MLKHTRIIVVGESQPQTHSRFFFTAWAQISRWVREQERKITKKKSRMKWLRSGTRRSKIIFYPKCHVPSPQRCWLLKQRENALKNVWISPSCLFLLLLVSSSASFPFCCCCCCCWCGLKMLFRIFFVLH